MTALAFSPDGTVVASGSRFTVHLWDAASGKETSRWSAHDGYVRAVAFSPDGRRLYTGGADRVVRVWDLATGRPAEEWRGHEGEVRGLAVSPDGTKVLSAGADKTLRLWDAASGRSLGVWTGHSWNVNSVAFSPDGRRAVSGSLDLTIKVWDVTRGKELMELAGHSAEVNSVRFSPDGKTILSGSSDNTMRLWDAASGKELSSWTAHRKAVYAVAFSVDGKLGISGSQDKSLKLWDLASGKELSAWKGHINAVNVLAVSPDGRRVVSGGDDETLKVWKLSGGKAAPAAIPKPKSPPKLVARVSFFEPSGNDALDGGEQGALKVSVTNSGTGTAYAVRLVASHAPFAGLATPAPIELGDLETGKTIETQVPLEASEAAASGQVQMRLEVGEGNGFDAAPQLVEFEVRAHKASRLELAGLALSGGIVRAGEVTEVTLTVKNTGEGAAKRVVAKLVLEGSDVFPSGETSLELGDLEPGRSAIAEFSFVVNNRFKGKALPVSVSLAAGSAAPALLPLGLTIGQAAPSVQLLSIKGKAQPQAAPAAEAPGEDVDVPPQTTTPVDPEAYAVVIGIEKYRQKGIPAVDYAVRDAQAMYGYLTKSMGFDEKNVTLLLNDQATKTDLDKYLGPWLENRVTEKSRVFIYYAGHGAPNPKTQEGYLIPYEGDPNYTEVTSFPIKRLYETLAKLPAKDILVTTDACFSGQGNRSVMAKGARPLVSVIDQSGAVGKNTVVLAATGGDQISTYYPDGQHGLLTYFLLKGLKGEGDADKNGQITTIELFDYVRPAVEREAKRQNVSQVPTLSPAPSALGARGRRVWLQSK